MTAAAIIACPVRPERVIDATSTAPMNGSEDSRISSIGNPGHVSGEAFVPSLKSDRNLGPEENRTSQSISVPRFAEISHIATGLAATCALIWNAFAAPALKSSLNIVASPAVRRQNSWDWRSLKSVGLIWLADLKRPSQRSKRL